MPRNWGLKLNNQIPEDFVVFDSLPCRYTKVCAESYDKFVWSLGWIWDDNVTVESAKQAFNGEVFVKVLQDTN